MITPKCTMDYKQEDCWDKYNAKMDAGGYMSDKPGKAIATKVKIPSKERMPNSTLKRSTKPIKVNYYDKEYEEFQNAVWQRELKMDMPPNGHFPQWTKACQFWKCLSAAEKKTFLETSKGEEWKLTTIQVCHIRGKGAHADLKYEPSNAILGNFVFHSRIDTSIDPVTNKPMSKQERIAWFERIKNHTAITEEEHI